MFKLQSWDYFHLYLNLLQVMVLDLLSLLPKNSKDDYSQYEIQELNLVVSGFDYINTLDIYLLV